MSEVTVALVGCGWISEAHVQGYRDLWEHGFRQFRITACCDMNAEAARMRANQIAQFQGSVPAIYTDVASLGTSGIAMAADICLPHCFHHRNAIALLESGMHVMCEKPLGITIRASKAIIEAASRGDRILATAENTRRHLGSRAAVWAVQQAGLIGEPLHGVVTVARNQISNLSDPKWAWRNVKMITGGGPLIDGGAHFADMAIQLFGPVAEVSCEMKSLVPATEVVVPSIGKTVTDVEDWWHADIRFRSGMRLSWTYANPVPGAEVTSAVYLGRKGILTDESGWPFHAFEGGGNVRGAAGLAIAARELEQRYLASLNAATRERLFPHGTTNSFAIEIWDFIDAITQKRKPEMDGLDGLRSKALCLSCYESATLGGARVMYDDVLSGAIDAYQRPLDTQWGLLEVTDLGSASARVGRASGG